MFAWTRPKSRISSAIISGETKKEMEMFGC